MFWKRKETKETKEGEAKLPEPKKRPEGKLSRKEIVRNQLEQLTDGRSLTYILPEYMWSGGAFTIVELNPKYPETGKKYLVFSDQIKDGQPAGKKELTSSYNKLEEVLNLIDTRSGEPVS